MHLDTTIPSLPVRPDDANKGDFGRVVVVAGSLEMSGAAVLCGTAALRGGAGLVRVATPRSAQPMVAVGNPCYMTSPLPDDADGRLSRQAEDKLLELAHSATALVMGPGLGLTPVLSELVSVVLRETTTALVLDADALNALVADPTRLTQHHGPVILTPHPGEFGRLVGADVATVQADRQGLATQFAHTHRCIVVLKGAGTIVTDGERLAINATGNPGMATGGTGDVLAGLIAALLAQGLSPYEAARLGVYLHGLAGDLACDEQGQTGLIALDLLTHLPRALLQHARR